jgi:hypothetical protein
MLNGSYTPLSIQASFTSIDKSFQAKEKMLQYFFLDEKKRDDRSEAAECEAVSTELASGFGHSVEQGRSHSCCSAYYRGYNRGQQRLS